MVTNMSTSAPRATVHELEARLADQAAPGSLDEGELDGLPDPVRRYVMTSIAPGAPLARSARFRMHGSIKLGRLWLPFQAREILAPHHGFAWAARVAGVVVGSDQLIDGEGTMEWKLLGLVRLMHAEGPDVSRSSAGRVGGESFWVPTAMLPRFGVSWYDTDPHHVTASYRLGDIQVEVNYILDDYARVRSLALDRWGDPDNAGIWGLHPFGHEATRYSTFDGVTIPSAGRAGWFYGTDRWSEGEFFRYEITELHLVT